MKNILVPTDFSPTAEKAFRFACNLATKTNSKVVLYHVFTPLENTFIDTGEKRKQYNLQMEANLQKRLQRLKRKVSGEYSAIVIETILARSPLFDQILGFAEHHAIDLIVMGTQGASGLKKVIVGSVASRIAEESEIPVLLVPEKFDLKEPEKIVFATDYELSEIAPLNFSIALAQLYKADITMVHLVDDHEKAGHDEGPAVFKVLAEQHPSPLSNFPLLFRSIPSHNIHQSMQSLYNEVPYDLLVMVRRNRSFIQKLFLKSFTKSMSCITHYPFLVIPAGYKPIEHANNISIAENAL